MQNLVRTPKNLGHAIRQARRDKSWTQAELATRSGVWQETISKAEAEKGGTKLDTIFALLAALNLEWTCPALVPLQVLVYARVLNVLNSKSFRR